jgi:DNA-binding transcriptional LysR family regulator
MRFEWSDLRIFLAVCEAGSMTRAAARCHLTLAAVSARMRKLEETVGVALLRRHARGVQPSPAGEALAVHARVLFEQMQAIESDLLRAPRVAVRRCVLLVNSSALAGSLADVLAMFSPAPDQPLLVRESYSEATVQAVRSGAADLGIVSDAVDVRGLVTADLGADPLVVAVPRGHALASRDSISLQEALGQPWVSWGEHGALSAHLQMRALALGTPIVPRVTYPALPGLLRWIEEGHGVTVLPAATVRGSASTRIACVPLADRWARRRLLVCRVDDEDRCRSALFTHIAASFRTVEAGTLNPAVPAPASPSAAG